MVLAITRKELIGGGRAAKWYVLRAGFLIVLCLVTVPAIFAIANEIARTPGFKSFSRGGEYTLSFGLLELAMIALLAPALSITSVASEKASGILELLHVANVSPRQVVFGKLVSRVALLSLFIVSSLPLLFVGTVLGGVGAEAIGVIVANCFGMAVLGTGIGLAVSGVVRSTIPAMLLAYGLTIAVHGLPIAIGMLLELFVGNGSGSVIYLFSAPLALLASRNPTLILSPGSTIGAMQWMSSIAMVAAGCVFALLAIPFAKPSLERTRAETLAEKGIEALEGVSGSARRKSEAVTGNPVAWREARSHRFGFGVRVVRLLYLSFGGALAVHLLLFAVIGDFRDLARGGVAILSLAAAGVTMIVASTSIASERESRALPLLSISRLTPSDILTGKLEGLWLFLWPVAILPVIPAIAFLGIDFFSFLVSVLMTFVLILSAAGIGLFFSAFAKRPATAIWASISVSSAWLALLPYAIFTWCRHGCRGEENVIALLNPVALVLDLTAGFARRSGERHIFMTAEPWAPYGGMLLLLFVTFLAFGCATWRLSYGADA